MTFAWYFEGHFDEVFGRNNFTNISGMSTKGGNLGRSGYTTNYGGRAIASKTFTPDEGRGFTVEFYVLINELRDPAASPGSGTYYRIVSARNAAGTAGWYFSYGDAYSGGAPPYVIRFTADQGGNPSQTQSGTIQTPPTSWFHVAGVWEPSGGNNIVRLFLDGTQQGSGYAGTNGAFSGLNPIELGQGGTSGRFEIDSLVIWDFPLTAAQVDRVRVGQFP
jgi:hypothetical protein